VAVSGNTVVVGAYYDDTGATDAGAAYMFDAATGVLLRTLVNPTPALEDFFGSSVAISGNTVVVGAYRDDTGATDAGTAYVFDSARAPTDIRLSSTGIAENQLADTRIGTFTTTDPNLPDDRHTYTLVSGSGDNDNDKFTIDGTQLKTAAVFDYEAKASYSIRVRTTDQGGLWCERVFTVAVTDVNDPPTDLSLSATSLAEDQPAATVVGTFSTTDPEAPAGPFTYTLVSGTGSTDNRCFAISGGQLKTAVTLNYEEKTSYSIRVRTTDAGGLWYEEAITITVSDVVALGDLLYTLDDPSITPQASSQFGTAVAADGDLVVVGNPDADIQGVDAVGVAHVFNRTTGTLVATLQNPTPAADDFFGYSVAISGSTVIVGAIGDDTGATNIGSAYVFDAATGALLHTLANPTPAANDFFGWSVAVSGTMVVVGARGDDSVVTDVGAAYVFDAATGALLHTLANPTPGAYDWFGFDVAVSGNTLVVGALDDNTGAPDAGAAYVFDGATGTLLRTLTNPTPAVCDEFGYSVAVSGNTVVVGAYYDDTGARDAGAAYMFDAATGVLLRTLANPVPAVEDRFGHSVAASGNTVVVGALYDDTGAQDAGAAYVFDGARAPTDIRLSSASIAENQLVGSFVGTFTTTDPNLPDDSHTYTLAVGSGDTDNVKFTIDGNQLKTAAVFDYEAKSSYSIRVRTTDAGGLYCEEVFIIGVEDITPTVTINQTTGQADPATGGPILFTVEFSEAVTGFDWTDIDFTGSTTMGMGATVSPVNGSTRTYVVSVRGMSEAGTVKVTIPAGKAQNGGGDWNMASTSTDNTVNYQPSPHTASQLGAYSLGGWFRDTNGNNALDPSDEGVKFFGPQGATPVPGDWNGDGKDEFGVYANGAWYLDLDGNGLQNEGGMNYGPQGALPVVGDWNGDGKDEIGLFKDGIWFLDANANRQWDTADYTNPAMLGWAGATPVVGDWNGDGRDDLGVYANGMWFRDRDGNGTYTAAEQAAAVAFGWPGMQPVVGDWNGDGKDNLGIYYQGGWFRDVNANNQWDENDASHPVFVGWAGATPIVGVWGAISLANQTPTDIRLSETSVLENRPAGMIVGYFWTTDPDGPGAFTCSLVSGPGGKDNAQFTIEGNRLCTAARFDYETQSSYSIRVRTTDAGGLFYEKAFTISVGDLDDTRPTVTINQKTDQVDPATSGPIRFTVVFSEPMYGFNGTDVSFTGSTAAGALTATVTGSGTTYEVAVSGMSGTGTVKVAIPAGKAQDAACNPNEASTSTDNTVSYQLPLSAHTVSRLGAYNLGGWFLDTNVNDRLDPDEGVKFFGWQGLTPVPGDWNGDGTDDFGVCVNSTWYLDLNGDGVMNDGSISFGWEGTLPVVGDWNGDGRDEIGVFKDGAWFRDVNANRQWDSADSASPAMLGWAGATPVVGDWNGDGKDDMGVYAAGMWFRDLNGDGTYTSSEQAAAVAFGWSGMQAVVGDWNADGKDEMGIYYQGGWFRDLNANNQWDSVDASNQVFFGWAGATPIVGVWGTSQTQLAAEGEVTPSAELPALSESEVEPIVSEAMSRWAAAGLNSQALARLAAVEYVIADLPGSQLAKVENGRVYLDRDAAGHGWFVDRTPGQDEEFLASDVGTLRALDSQAVDRVDLLTVVEHELGHLVGLEDLDGATDELMSRTLLSGQRRAPRVAEIDAVLAEID
jgi:hypothetical protein